MLKKYNKFVIGFVFACLLPSCSVIMAAKKDGVSLGKVQTCRTRGQFLSYGAVILNSEYLPNGDLVELYQFKAERGSAARAFMHGILDVSTFGLWEVVGTPIECFTNENKYFTLRVFYDYNDNLKKIELL